MLDEGFNQGQLKIPSNYETMDVKRISNYMSSPEFARNVQLIGIQTIHQGGRSAVETTSSSSEEDDSSTESSSFEE
ncbi:unnamed protein product [Cuscuta campestris]|uniref:Uncharacterized protein n=1 Tax=Cuscuta campestris TaxID=132261 RepID=A0A484MIG8_9ASTE|nr:unnamed protein product [Cuscuta campestris]